MDSQHDGGGAAGGGGAVPEGKDAGEGNRSDEAAEEKDTHARDDVLKDMMKEDREGFNINTIDALPGWV